MTAAVEPGRLGHRPALDGLRGVAVIAVLLFHGDVVWGGGGFLGVSTFFTLSGFLITALLLTEFDGHGSIGLGGFWARRARRLLPAALVALAGIVAFGWRFADPSQLARLRGDVLASLGYVANWRFIAEDQSYAAAFDSPSPAQHFWSLAVEEQFYILFPLLVAGALWVGARRGRSGSSRTRLLGLFAVLGALSVGLGLILGETGDPSGRVYYGTDTRAAELLVGAALAALIIGRRIDDNRFTRPLAVGGGVIGLAGLGLAYGSVSLDSEWLYHGGFVAIAGLGALTVFAAWVGDNPAATVLAFSPLRALGRISYGTYLYHWPIFLVLDQARTELDGVSLFALRVGVTLAVAVVSYHVIELPIRERRSVISSVQLPALVGATAAVVLAAVVVTADPPPSDLDLTAFNGAPPAPSVPQQRPPDPASIGEATVSTGSTAATDQPAPVGRLQPVKVMVVGDSLAWSLGIGLSGWADRTGQAVVWNVAQIGCGVAEGGTVDTHLNPCEEGIDSWPAKLDEYQPDVIVMLTGPWELYDRSFGDGAPTEPGDAQFDRWLTGEFVRAVDVLAADGADVVWLTSPCIEETARAGTFEGAEVFDPERTRILNEDIIAAVAAQRPDEVVVRDLFGFLCPPGGYTAQVGPVEEGRPDGIHFADEAKPFLADWLMPKLLTDPVAP